MTIHFVDRVDSETRSRVMTTVKARGNRSTELVLRLLLVRAGLRGWRVQPRYPVGRCDFVFEQAALAIFVDGCQWHGCPRCYRPPKSNRTYWSRKLKRNRVRDAEVNRLLRREGWQVIRIWEHQLREHPGSVLRKIRKALADATNRGAY